jgi:hypothetical protein
MGISQLGSDGYGSRRRRNTANRDFLIACGEMRSGKHSKNGKSKRKKAKK